MEGRKTDNLCSRGLRNLRSWIILGSSMSYPWILKLTPFHPHLQHVQHPQSCTLPPSSSHNFYSMMEERNKDDLSLKPLGHLSSSGLFNGSLMSEPRGGEQEPKYNCWASMKSCLFLKLYPIQYILTSRNSVMYHHSHIIEWLFHIFFMGQKLGQDELLHSEFCYEWP